jgi:hypothetical protein
MIPKWSKRLSLSGQRVVKETESVKEPQRTEQAQQTCSAAAAPGPETVTPRPGSLRYYTRRLVRPRRPDAYGLVHK